MSSPATRILAILSTVLTTSTVLAAGSAATTAPKSHRLSSLAASASSARRADTAATHTSHKVSGSVHYARNVRAGCAHPNTPNALRCFAIKRVAATASTPGAYPFVVPNSAAKSMSSDLLRGLKAVDFEKAYGYDPDIDRSSVTVGIVDWNDDPHALSDLNHFDHDNGLKSETSRSFRKVNQRGQTGNYPVPSRDSAPEIALDIEAVRAVCHTCRILLVEAEDSSMDNVAAAENRAVAMGASVISNSFGGPEQRMPRNLVSAFNHPGVVITASTGDDGWYGWDYSRQGNSPYYVSDDAASFPATSPNVVAVGGTSLQLNNDGTRLTETVWNNNGRSASSQHLGATGGGCSKLYTAPAWQAHQANYSSAGCHGKRLAADVAADADPASGLRVYDTYGTGNHGNVVIGGTSLSAPLTAAMFALAGGSGGSAYAAASLYVNSKRSPSTLFDIKPLADDEAAGRTSGNSYCGGVDATECGKSVHDMAGTYNPNDLANSRGDYVGLLDCTFVRKMQNHTASGRKLECNTVTGFDGPTGLGTARSVNLYKRTIFRLSTSIPSTTRISRLTPFTAKGTPTLSGSKVDHYTWSWGDGSATSYLSYESTHHTFRKKGTFVVTLGVTDSYYQVVIKRIKIKVS